MPIRILGLLILLLVSSTLTIVFTGYKWYYDYEVKGWLAFILPENTGFNLTSFRERIHWLGTDPGKYIVNTSGFRGIVYKPFYRWDTIVFVGEITINGSERVLIETMAVDSPYHYQFIKETPSLVINQSIVEKALAGTNWTLIKNNTRIEQDKCMKQNTTMITSPYGSTGYCKRILRQFILYYPANGVPIIKLYIVSWAFQEIPRKSFTRFEIYSRENNTLIKNAVITLLDRLGVHGLNIKWRYEARKPSIEGLYSIVNIEIEYLSRIGVINYNGSLNPPAGIGLNTTLIITNDGYKILNNSTLLSLPDLPIPPSMIPIDPAHPYGLRTTTTIRGGFAETTSSVKTSSPPGIDPRWLYLITAFIISLAAAYTAYYFSKPR